MQLSIGHCYINLTNYTEALNTYFKIELSSKNAQKSWRPIIWCSFISQRLEQAQKYYVKILEQKPTSHDYINAGHVQLALHNSTQAIQLYKQGISGLDNDIRKFLKILDEDKVYLLSYDIAPSDLPILIDKLRYDLD